MLDNLHHFFNSLNVNSTASVLLFGLKPNALLNLVLSKK